MSVPTRWAEHPGTPLDMDENSKYTDFIGGGVKWLHCFNR